MNFKLLLMALTMVLFLGNVNGEEGSFVLKTNLDKAKTGDYLVTNQYKNYTLLLVKGRENNTLMIEEITIPAASVSKEKGFSWKQWVQNGCLANTARVVYYIDLQTGTVKQTFSISKNEWINISQSQSYLTTLLNLKLTKIKDIDRKRIGPAPSSDSIDRRKIWNPPLIVEGQTIAGVPFDAWRTHWPKDGSELSGKTIEIFLPKDSDKYPSYFPYWLQISGIIGKAKIRIVDSGSHLYQPPLENPI
jgi:hypothetical protein